MIVADTNLVAALILGGPDCTTAQKVLTRDPEWAAPVLWRSEFLSVLSAHMRQRGLTIADAMRAYELATALFAGREFAIPGARILEIVAATRLSAYDAEYVALARSLGTALITADRQVLRECSDSAVSAASFLTRS